MEFHYLPVQFFVNPNIRSSGVNVGFIVANKRRWEVHSKIPYKARAAAGPGWDLDLTMAHYCERLEEECRTHLASGDPRDGLLALSRAWKARSIQPAREPEVLEAGSIEEAVRDLLETVGPVDTPVQRPQ